MDNRSIKMKSMRHYEKERPSKLSIFMKNEIRVPATSPLHALLESPRTSGAPVNVSVNTNSQVGQQSEDGCLSCLKSVFKSMRR